MTTDPAVGHWRITARPGGVLCEHDGDPHALAEWVLHAVHVAQSAEGLRRRAARDGRPPRPARGDVDPLVTQLRQVRLDMGVAITTVDRVLRSRTGPYERGDVQPPLPTARAWAYLFGLDLKAVPR